MQSREMINRDDKSWARNRERFALKDPPTSTSKALRIYSGQAAKAAAGIGALALCAVVFYRVRELLAALILFSAVFGVVIVAILILWLLGQATHEAAVRLEKQMARIPARRIFAPARAHAGHVHRNPPWD